MHAPGCLSGVGRFADAGITINITPIIVSATRPVSTCPIPPTPPHVSCFVSLDRSFQCAISAILVHQSMSRWVTGRVRGLLCEITVSEPLNQRPAFVKNVNLPTAQAPIKPVGVILWRERDLNPHLRPHCNAAKAEFHNPGD